MQALKGDELHEVGQAIAIAIGEKLYPDVRERLSKQMEISQAAIAAMRAVLAAGIGFGRNGVVAPSDDEEGGS